MDSTQISTGLMVLFVFLALWELVWKGLALWKAAQNGAKAWFVVMLVLNTVGILPIIYYFFIDGKCCDNCCKNEK